MDVVTLRLEPDLVEELEAEADEKGFSNRTEYIRFLLRNRSEHTGENIGASGQNTSEYDSTLEELVDRVGRIEERLPELEPVEQWGNESQPQESHSTPAERSEPVDVHSSGPIEEPRENEPAATETNYTDLDEILEGWPPRAESKREQRKQAGLAALEYLRETGEAKATDFKNDIEPEAPVDGQSPNTWWKKAARPALNQAQEAGLVEFIDGAKVYSWVGEQ